MPDEYLNIGDKLSQKRKELGKELTNISEVIKVSVEYLKAIEKGDFKSLPSIVYYKLFVRAYAQELDLDGNQLLEQFEVDDESVESDEGTLSEKKEVNKKRSRPESETPLLKIGLILALVVIAVFVIIIMFVPHGEEETVATESTQYTDPVKIVPDEQSDSKEDTISTEDNTPPPEKLPMKLDISINETSWTLVVADGDTVLNNNLETGSTRSYSADYRFVISMGNPYGVELKINDTLLMDISVSGRPVKGMEINRLNKADYFHLPEDSLVE